MNNGDPGHHRGYLQPKSAPTTVRIFMRLDGSASYSRCDAESIDDLTPAQAAGLLAEGASVEVAVLQSDGLIRETRDSYRLDLVG